MTSESDGYRTEGAVQFGFKHTNDDADEYACAEAALIAYAKACERKGRADAIVLLETLCSTAAARILRERNAAVDAELKPILEAEEIRFMTAEGYVRGPGAPGKNWIKP